jgi:hypothetical protein
MGVGPGSGGVLAGVRFPNYGGHEQNQEHDHRGHRGNTEEDQERYVQDTI